MKKKLILILIALVVLCLLPLWWIDMTNFDKYKFTEEYYKFIAYSVQLLCFGAVFSLILNNVIEKRRETKKQEQISFYILQQKEYIKTIKKWFSNDNKEVLAEALKGFKITSILLSDIDSVEKVQLEKLDYWDKVKPEIKFILDYINDDSSNMQQAISTINSFLDKYLDNRETS